MPPTPSRWEPAAIELATEALSGADVAGLMDRSARLVARALGIRFSAIFVGPVLRAGTGWRRGCIGQARPVARLRREHGIAGGVSVPLPGRRGLVGAYSERKRTFTRDEVRFLRSVAGVLGAALGRAPDSLQRERERLAAIIDMAEDAIVSIDAAHRMILFNRGAERMFGYRAREVVGRPLNMLLPERYRAGHTELIDQFGRSADPSADVTRCREILGLKKNGTVFSAECSISRLSQKGQMIFTAILRDVTERKSLEEQFRQAQKMEAIGRLAGGVAHDFNNLMMVIGSYSEFLLQRMDPTDPRREDVQKIKKAEERAAELTSRLLAFSRKQILDPRVLDLNAVVAETQKMLERVIGEDVELALKLAAAPGRVKADPGQIEQVIMNLAVNARDAMEEGGRLTIETANVELDELYAQAHIDVRPGPYVMLGVSDTGCGMSAETISHVFEPFFTTKEKGKGTGLGLSAVYGIVRQSGGQISVYSEPGRGTSFRIFLPRVEEAADMRARGPALAETPRGTETILLVEDEAGVREPVRDGLRRQGYRVIEAGGGAEALREARQFKGTIHLLITDVVMPRMGGRELAVRLRRMRPGVKVLFMSGYAGGGGLEAGAHFLAKPFSPEKLARKVREVIEG